MYTHIHHIYIYIGNYIVTYIHVCMHTYIHTFIHTYIYIHIHIHTLESKVLLWDALYVTILYVYTYMYVYIYIYIVRRRCCRTCYKEDMYGVSRARISVRSSSDGVYMYTCMYTHTSEKPVYTHISAAEVGPCIGMCINTYLYLYMCVCNANLCADIRPEVHTYLCVCINIYRYVYIC